MKWPGNTPVPFPILSQAYRNAVNALFETITVIEDDNAWVIVLRNTIARSIRLSSSHEMAFQDSKGWIVGEKEP